jgi:uncharacterized protein YqjF (DUF2071 family)
VVGTEHARNLAAARAEIVDIDDELLDAGAVQSAGEPLRALFSPGVRTRFGRPVVVR